MRSEGENLQHVSLKETKLLPHAKKQDEILSVAKQRLKNKGIKEETWHESYPTRGELFREGSESERARGANLKS